MTIKFKYNTVIKYEVTAVCTQPLHIGSALGDKEEVLIHPVDEIPFIQATSLAGVFRSYYEKVQKEPKAVNLLFGGKEFGENENSSEYGSKIRFSEGVFLKEEVKMELRPRVSIDGVSGTCAQSIVKGTSRASGHKFNMEYIGAGAKFKFFIYLYDETKMADVEEIFSAIHQETIAFGGQKSNGCGYIKLEKLYRKKFDMKQKKDRDLWVNEEQMKSSDYEDILSSLQKTNVLQNAYDIVVEGETEGSLLVKGIVVGNYKKDTQCGKNNQNAKKDMQYNMNIQNAKKEYIIPGSSFKGAIRNQMSKIADYLQQSEVIQNTFGYAGNENNQGKIGNITFYDTVVGEKDKNDKMPLSHRIHIDKFTGGVMQRGLFSEKNIAGDMTFQIGIADKNEPEKTFGILLMALRDLAIGTMSIGSGYNIGKGIIKVKKITITDNKCQREAVIDFSKNKIEDTQNLIADCMRTVI